MDTFEPLFSDSEDELEVDFSSSTGSLSNSPSTYTLDSGLSSGTWTESDGSWSPFEVDHIEDSLFPFTGPTLCSEVQKSLIRQAVYYLSSQDVEHLIGASACLFQLCKSGCGFLLIECCPDIMLHVLSVVRSPHSICPHILHFLSGMLYYLSHTEPGVDLILTPPGVQVLSSLLTIPVESVLYYTVTALHSILLVRKPARDIIRDSGMVARLIALLKLPVRCTEEVIESRSFDPVNPKFLAILCDCLHILAYAHEKTKRIFVEQSAVPYLMKLICSSQYEKLLWTGVRLLRVLSAWMPVKLEVLTQDSSMTFLTHCLNKGSLRVIASALWTLRNLSDLVIDKIPTNDMNNVISLLLEQMKNALEFLESPSVSPSSAEFKDRLALCRCILDITGNLTCGNVNVKSQMVELNGVDLISRITVLASSSTKRPQQPQAVSRPSGRNKLKPVLCESFSTLSVKSNSCTPPEGSDSLNTSETQLHPAARGIRGNFCSSCSMGRSSVSSRSPSSTWSTIPSKNSLLLTENFDLLEAGFRCLSHLTAGHAEAPRALTCFVHQCCSSQLLSDTADRVLLTLLPYQASAPCTSNQLGHKIWPPTFNDQDLGRTLHLLKAWCSLLNNLASVYCTKTSNGFRTRTGLHKSPSRPFLSHLRRSLRSATERLNKLSELLPDPPQDLAAVRQLVRTVSEKFSVGSPALEISLSMGD